MPKMISANFLSQKIYSLGPFLSLKVYFNNYLIFKGTEVEVFEDFPDLEALKEFVDEAVHEVVKEMKNRHPEKKFDEEELEKDAFAIVANFFQGQLKKTKVTLPDPKDCPDCQRLPFQGYETFPKVCNFQDYSMTNLDLKSVPSFFGDRAQRGPHCILR